MKLPLRILLIASFGIVTYSGAQGQSSAASDITISSLESIQGKFIEIAKDFPQDLYDFQPHSDSRSFIKEIWHASSGFGVLAARIRGTRPGADLINIPEDIKYDKEKIVDHLTNNSNDCIQLLKKQFDPRSISTLAHLSEHYGKIVTLYRVNNLVPPNSKD